MHRPQDRHRSSLRLKGYDYSQPGAYFVTMCTQSRECLFGEIANDEVMLNEYGKVVEEEWLKTPRMRTRVELDEFVVMPNHLHAIMMIPRGGGDDVNGSRSAQHVCPNHWARLSQGSSLPSQSVSTYCVCRQVSQCGSATTMSTLFETRMT